MHKKILFDGAYGINSFGDDTPLLVMTEMLRNRIEKPKFVVVSRHPDENQYVKYGIESIHGIEYRNRHESINKWFRGFNPNDDKIDLCRLYAEIESSDLLVLGAGNFLVDYTIDILKGPVSRFLLMSLMARMTSTPVMWFGISVGPLNTKMGKDMTRLAAEIASVITVRDEKSIHELSALNFNNSIIRLPDAAYKIALPKIDRAKKFTSWVKAHQTGQPVIAISTRSLPKGCAIENSEYFSILANAFDMIIENMGYTFLFIPQCTYTHSREEDDDRVIARNIISRMKFDNNVFTIDDDIDLFDCLSLYQDSFAAICTRLHGNVFAALQGVPVIGINYNPKIHEFYKWIGFEDLSIEMNELSSSIIIHKLNQLTQIRENFISKTIIKLNSASTEIEKYADIAIESLKDNSLLV